MELSHYTEYTLEKCKTNYYFDKYKFKIYVRTENIFLLRGLKNIENLDEYLNRDCYTHSYLSHARKSVSDVMGNYADINVEIKKFILELVAAKVDIKVMFCGANSIMIYHHEETKNKIQELISKLVSLYDEVKTPKLNIKLLYSTKLDNFEKGVIYQVNPKYKYRMYFGSSSRMQKDDLARVKDYLTDENNDIKLNLSAIRWIRHRNTNVIWYNMTIDMNSDYHATYLNMLHPGIVLKLCKIEKRINTKETDEVNCGENLRKIDSNQSEQVS